MNGSRPPPADRAAELRRQFDRAFAAARPPDPPPSEDLLAIRLGGETFALRLAEVAGVFAGLPVTPIPGQEPPLCGIAGLRGELIPVYDLAAIFGHPPIEPVSVRWLARAAAATAAFAVTGIDGTRRVPRDAVIAHRDGADDRHPVRGFVRTGDLACPVIALDAVIATIRPRAGGPLRQEP